MENELHELSLKIFNPLSKLQISTSISIETDLWVIGLSIYNQIELIWILLNSL